MKATIATVALAATPLVAAVPLQLGAKSAPNVMSILSVHTLAAGTNITSARNAPNDLAPGTKALLDKYQPFSNAASSFLGSSNNTHPAVSGDCFAEFPCSSISRVATADVDGLSGPTDGEVSTLLDRMISMPTATFDQSDRSTMVSGLKQSTGVNGTTVYVMSAPGSMDSRVLAGMVWDMYKAAAPMGNAKTANAIRATPAWKDGHPLAELALCMYSSALEGPNVLDFCMGRDGSISASPSAKRDVAATSIHKRGLCDIIDIPILCTLIGFIS